VTGGTGGSHLVVSRCPRCCPLIQAKRYDPNSNSLQVGKRDLSPLLPFDSNQEVSSKQKQFTGWEEGFIPAAAP